MSKPEKIGRPTLAYLPLELMQSRLEQMTFRTSSKILLRTVPDGDGHPVMVLPGLLKDDKSTKRMRSILFSKGYDVHPWGLGRNFGPRTAGKDVYKLIARVERLYDLHGEKVSLIGWSLGGILARQVAKRRPDLVRQVITMGSPFRGGPDSSVLGPVHRFINNDDDLGTLEELMTRIGPPPACPSTAIFTRTDGIVNWRGCLELPGPMTDNVEVYASHMGIIANPFVLYVVADRLAVPEGEWTPFNRMTAPWRRLAYRSSGHTYGLKPAKGTKLA